MGAIFLSEAVRFSTVLAVVLLSGLYWKTAREPKLSGSVSVAAHLGSAYLSILTIVILLRGITLAFAFNASWITAVVLFVVAYCAGTRGPGVSTEYASAYGIVFFLFALAMGVIAGILWLVLHHQSAVAMVLAALLIAFILGSIAQGRKR